MTHLLAGIGMILCIAGALTFLFFAERESRREGIRQAAAE